MKGKNNQYEYNGTIIISCAGKGSRLGLDTTKALVEGKLLIMRLLEFLEKEEDIRIVVGFQAEAVINLVKEYRDDIMFVFNHDYSTTGTGHVYQLLEPVLPLNLLEIRSREIDTINDYEKACRWVRDGFCN